LELNGRGQPPAAHGSAWDRQDHFDGTERVIAHIDFPKMHRVGKYGVDVGAIDEATELLADDPAVQVYLVDEIGKMECLSERFVAAMRTLLIGPKPVVATIALRGRVRRGGETHAGCRHLGSE
jgi:nucleoside-triphosphatase THEP1